MWYKLQCVWWKEVQGECNPAPGRTLYCWERCWRAEFWSNGWRNWCRHIVQKGILKHVQSGKQALIRSFGHSWPIRVNPRRRARCWRSRLYLNFVQRNKWSDPLQLVCMTSMSHLKKNGMSIYSSIFQLCITACVLLTVRVHVGPFHPATAPLKTAVIFGLVDVHSFTRIYGTGNLSGNLPGILPFDKSRAFCHITKGGPPLGYFTAAASACVASLLHS